MALLAGNVTVQVIGASQNQPHIGKIVASPRTVKIIKCYITGIGIERRYNAISNKRLSKALSTCTLMPQCEMVNDE